MQYGVNGKGCNMEEGDEESLFRDHFCACYRFFVAKFVAVRSFPGPNCGSCRYSETVESGLLSAP